MKKKTTTNMQKLRVCERERERQRERAVMRNDNFRNGH